MKLFVMVVCMDLSLRAARVATFVYFVLDGALMGMWLVQIPVVEKRAEGIRAGLNSLESQIFRIAEGKHFE